MKIQHKDLTAAADEGILQQDQVEPLFNFIQRRNISQGMNPRFNGTHVLYYLGGVLAICAASLFAVFTVDALGMTALLVLTLLYAACAIGAAIWFEKHRLQIPASIFATLVIALSPLMVFALQHVLGFWADESKTQSYSDYWFGGHIWFDWRWIIMELATLLTGALMLMRFRYPFLVLPIAMTLWSLGMDAVSALVVQAGADNMYWLSEAVSELREMISLVFGLLMLLCAFFVDLRSRNGRDFAFWLYLFGLLTFWGALSWLYSEHLSGKLFYLILNLGLVFVGTILVRRTFAVFGGMGIMTVLVDMSWYMFKDSLAFVLMLTLLGFALIGIGVWWSRYETAISAKFLHMLPQDLRELLAARAAS